MGCSPGPVARPGSGKPGQGPLHAAGVASADPRVEADGLLIEGPHLVDAGGGLEGLAEQLPAAGTPTADAELVEFIDGATPVRLACREVARQGVGAAEPGERPSGVERITSRQQGAAGRGENLDGLGRTIGPEEELSPADVGDGHASLEGAPVELVVAGAAEGLSELAGLSEEGLGLVQPVNFEAHRAELVQGLCLSALIVVVSGEERTSVNASVA